MTCLKSFLLILITLFVFFYGTDSGKLDLETSVNLIEKLREKRQHYNYHHHHYHHHHHRNYDYDYGDIGAFAQPQGPPGQRRRQGPSFNRHGPPAPSFDNTEEYGPPGHRRGSHYPPGQARKYLNGPPWHRLRPGQRGKPRIPNPNNYDFNFRRRPSHFKKQEEHNQQEAYNIVEYIDDNFPVILLHEDDIR